jgi:C_GCAxxG_C_C family probable redox protein
MTMNDAPVTPTDDKGTDPADLAAKYAATGLTCSESVLRACNDANDLGLPESTYGIATPFGGGMSGLQLTCGAVTGGLMAIGLALGRQDVSEPVGPSFEAGKELHARFTERFGSDRCSQLLGDLVVHTPEQQAFCAQCMGFAASTVTDVLTRASAQEPAVDESTTGTD